MQSHIQISASHCRIQLFRQHQPPHLSPATTCLYSTTAHIRPSSRDMDGVYAGRLLKVAGLRDRSALWPAGNFFSHSAVSSSCVQLLDHKSCDSARQPLGSSLLGQHVGSSRARPASQLQDKCIYICNQKHSAYQDTASAALDVVCLTILVF